MPYKKLSKKTVSFYNYGFIFTCALHINSIVKEKTVQWKHFRIVLTVPCLIPDTQPRLDTQPQTYCKLSILPACQQLPTSLSISSSCKKSVKIRLVANCHLQTCKLKQVAINLQQFCWNNQLATNLLSTCNWLVVTSCRKPSKRILISACCNKLLQDVNRLVTTYALLAVSIQKIILVRTL